jgi:hypothetical protein
VKSTIDHPDDLRARVDLRTSLMSARDCLGLSVVAANRAAGFPHQGTLQTLEGATNWEMWRVQQWARGVGHVLRLHIEGLVVPADDVHSTILRATTAFGGFDADELHLRIVTADLVRARRHLKVSRSMLARRCRMDEKVLSTWEQDPGRSLMRIYQRYARELGGSVCPMLELAGVAVAP